MKKIKVILAILLIGIISKCRAEGIFSVGRAVDFQGGFVGSLWHPSMSFALYDSNDEASLRLDLLLIQLKDPYEYFSFPEESKLLIKFEDQTIFELNSFGDRTTDYNSMVVSNRVVEVHYTKRYFLVSEEVKQYLLSHPIIKVRIELSNGKLKDYDVSERVGKKVLNKLQDSYNQLNDVQQIMLNNANDLKNNF